MSDIAMPFLPIVKQVGILFGFVMTFALAFGLGTWFGRNGSGSF